MTFLDLYNIVKAQVVALYPDALFYTAIARNDNGIAVFQDLIDCRFLFYSAVIDSTIFGLFNGHISIQSPVDWWFYQKSQDYNTDQKNTLLGLNASESDIVLTFEELLSLVMGQYTDIIVSENAEYATKIADAPDQETKDALQKELDALLATHKINMINIYLPIFGDEQTHAFFRVNTIDNRTFVLNAYLGGIVEI